VVANGGQDVTFEDVQCYRHAQGFQLTNSGADGIYFHGSRLYTCGITDADAVVSGWPGAYFSHSTFGCNGAFDVTHNTYVRVTGNWDLTAGTVHFVDDHFNLGQNTVVCGIAFQSFTGTTKQLYDFNLLGGHMETAQNPFCTDSTVLGFINFTVDDIWFGGGWGGGNHVFADLSNGQAAGLNAATSLSGFNFSNVVFGGFTDLTLAPAAQIADLRLHDSSFLNDTISITGATNSSLQLVNNTYGGNVTLAGNFAFARASGNFQAGNFLNSATGTVEADFPGLSQESLTNNSATCKLAIGGSTTGITYTQQPVSQWQVVGNQVYVSIYMSITSLGSLTGAATMTGCLPFTSAPSNVSHNLVEGTGWVSLTSPVIAGVGAASKVLNLYETGTTGLSPITNANISAGPTTLYGEVIYTVNAAP
jgi:hypothetical protein